MANEFETEFNYMKNTFLLKIFIDGARHDDIESIERGAIEIGLYIEQPVIFLLFKFHAGDISSNVHLCGDAPFTYHLVPPDFRSIPGENEQVGRMEIGLFDNCTMKVGRVIGFGRNFLDVFRNAIIIQSKSTWNVKKYDAKINEIYAKMTCKDMFPLSLVIVIVPNKN